MNDVDELIKALRCNGKNLENCRKCDYSIFTGGGMPICNKETRIYKKAADALEQLQAESKQLRKECSSEGTYAKLRDYWYEESERFRIENISLRAERDALLKSTMKVSEEIETIQPRGLLE